MKVDPDMAECLHLLVDNSKALAEDLGRLRGEIEAAGAAGITIAISRHLDEIIHRHNSFRTSLWAVSTELGGT